MDLIRGYEKEKKRIKEQIITKLKLHFGVTVKEASQNQLYKAVALVARDAIMEKWTESQKYVGQTQGKKLYYLSMEFLIGRSLGNNLLNLISKEVYQDACEELGIDLDKLEESEPDAGLGNGGLGRLAACFLESLTTMGLPACGCGIRYEYGLFKQRIIDGYQTEMPDHWLEWGNVWEIPKPEDQVEVHFGGQVIRREENGRIVFDHRDYHTVLAVPYDVPVVGYDSSVVNTLRLWSAKSPKHIDMRWFSRGDYIKATAEKELAEVISKVLYPEDNHYEGKALRLKQQYFFVSASIQSIIRDFKKRHRRLEDLPDRTVIHINDTHPALAIPELMRVLIDQEGMDWDKAWDITVRTCAYTNHTVMAEALERWPVPMFRNLLPRIYMIVHEINERYCRQLWNRYPGQWDKIAEMAIEAYDEIRMANLCVVGCSSVNGVSELHTDILKNQVFKDFYLMHPDKFCSVTNGMTHRRWLLHANPGLAKLISDTIGNTWIKKPWELKEIEKYADDPSFREVFRKIKRENKLRLAEYIKKVNGIQVNVDSIFDVQVKRLHEYKRQLLNVLHIMYLYNRLIEDPYMDIQPRTFIFGAKAAPGYHRAKLIIKLIHNLANKVNKDPRIGDKLKVVFMEDYRVSLAEKIIPAAEVSEQISTAGKEASGTGNMKFMLNGALTVGTLDGANIEIRQEVGPENIFIFGLTAEEVERYYRDGDYRAWEIFEQNPDLRKVLTQLIDGSLDPDNPELFKDIYNSLLYGDGGMADPYMVLKDFNSYTDIHERVQQEYRLPDIWNKKAIINVANAGYFSSDRSINDYNERIWNLSNLKRWQVNAGYWVV